jgi:hypothetical protein
MNQWIMGNPAQKRDCANTNYIISVTNEVFIMVLTVVTCRTKIFCSHLFHGLQMKLSIQQSDIWLVKEWNISTRNCYVFGLCPSPGTLNKLDLLPSLLKGWRHVLCYVQVQVTLRLAVYRQSVCLGVKPLETHDQNFFTPNWTLSLLVLT